MTDDQHEAFAEVIARLDDALSLAVEGQSRDNTPDMQRIIVGHLVTGLTGLHDILTTMSAEIDRRGL